jgi:hypothetical protein
LDGARGQKRFVGGFDEVYRAARDQRVELLVAPEDLTVTARLGSAHVEIIEPADDSVGPIEGDLVDVIVREVLGQGGDVVFLEQELLEPYGSIGAVNLRRLQRLGHSTRTLAPSPTSTHSMRAR